MCAYLPDRYWIQRCPVIRKGLVVSASDKMKENAEEKM